jgi:hypothetical protein
MSNPIISSMLDAWMPVIKKLPTMPIAWLALVPFVLVAILRLRLAKGWFGEKVVSLMLKLSLDKGCYTIIDDVTIPDGEGGTTQIDHLVVSPFGVFVVETKNMGGWIFGTEREATWTQKFRRAPARSFQNPMRQNYKHTETLAEALGVPREALFSVIVFVGDSHFKTPIPPNVTYGLGCVRPIKARREVLLSPEQVTQLVGAIEQLRLTPGAETHRQHVEYLRSRERAAAPPPAARPPPVARPQPAQVLPVSAERRCPQCGKGLILRTARQGAHAGSQFWGCAGFPSCRYTEKTG